MLTLHTFIIASLFAVLLINVEGYKICGRKHCNDDDLCDTSINGGTCYPEMPKTYCDDIFYCYQPTTCCGLNCCLEGSYCEDGECVTNRRLSRWWYGSFFIIPLIAIITVIVRCRRRAAITRVTQRRVIRTVPVQSGTDHYGYDQGPINFEFPQADNPNTGRPSDANGPPPAYNEVNKPKA